MYLFYAPLFTPPCDTLPEEESRHCVRVLRLAEGATVHVTDGCGNLHTCRIARADARGCRAEVLHTEREYGKLLYRLTMAVAPTKNADRYEWFLEKATEVGVSRIIPLETEHSERRVFKPQRGEKVITAAMKQSLKAYRPALDELTPFREVAQAPFEGRKLIAHCDTPRTPAGKRHLASLLRPGEEALVMIGPEGDFSPAEIDRAVALGFEEISLGEQRLRTETAAVAATVMAATVNRTPDR